MEKNNLYIPQGIKHKAEKFNGIPDECIKNIIMACIVFAIFDLIFWIFTKNIPIAFGMFFIQFTATGLYFRRDETTNISIADQLKFIMRFRKSQKKYPYKPLKEWDY